MRKPIVTSAAWLCISCFSYAQILNIGKNELYSDTTRKFLGNTTFSFVLYNRSADVDNPVEYLGFNLVANMAYFPGRHRISSITNMNYLLLNKEILTNTGYQHFRFDYLKDRKIHPEMFAQYQYDNFRGLDYRLLAGTGLRNNLINNDGYRLSISTGIMYESEKWTHPYIEQSINVRLWKSTNYIAFRAKFSEWVDFNAILYYQTGYDPSINAFRNRIYTDINLNARIANRFLWTTTFTMNYEDKPIVPIIKTIYNLTNGITVKF